MNVDFGQFKNLDDLKDVWDRLPSHDWQGLITAIQDVRNEKGDSESLNKAEKKAGEALSEGRDFPEDPMSLAAFLGGREAKPDQD